VITDHVEAGAPVVLEGDYLLPELAVRFGSAVRAVVLEQTDEQRIVSNYRIREPDSGDHYQRARVSVLVGAELVRRASRIGIPVVAAHPWTDTLDRVDGALRATLD
jgi:2-phosphoglycerate kinase